MECNNLSRSSLLDAEALSPYLSKKDLQDYADLPFAATDYFKKRFDLDLVIQLAIDADMPGLAWCVPKINHMTSLMDRICSEFVSKEPLLNKFIGHHIDGAHHVEFTAEIFTTKESEDVVGVFAHLRSDAEGTGHLKDIKFLEDLAGILYARNHGLQDLCAEGILGAYISHVGQ
jgi:hypothetical protein